jgi:hypothetical protein
MLKLVAAPTLQRKISEASNSQSQMKDWDFLFNDPTQQRLQREFRQMSTEVFYQLRRGEHIMTPTSAERVSIKDTAQATWAFLGAPAQAKDKLRDVPRSAATKSGVYREVFFDGVSASYLWLPWRTYRKVQEEYQKYYAAKQVGGDFREHGRLHILWLVGRGLTKGLGKKSYREVDGKTAAKLAENVDIWFPELHRIAVDAVDYVVDVKNDAAAQNNQTLQLRQLFRSSSGYGDFEKAHDKKLGDSHNLPDLKTLV